MCYYELMETRDLRSAENISFTGTVIRIWTFLLWRRHNSVVFVRIVKWWTFSRLQPWVSVETMDTPLIKRYMLVFGG